MPFISSGIIFACVVVTPPTLHPFICYAVEAYRLAFWIGIRSQIYWVSFPIVSQVLRPWSQVLLGMRKIDIQHAVDRFNEVFLFLFTLSFCSFFLKQKDIPVRSPSVKDFCTYFGSR